MQTLQKLEATKQKLDLLLKLSADFTDYCSSELQKLMELVEVEAAKNGGVSEHQGKMIAIKEQLEKQIESVLNGYKEEKESIALQLEALKSVNTVDQMDKMGEITSILLSEVDDKESLSVFKTRVLGQELEERRAFKDQVEDMKAVLNEGGILELEAFFEEWLMDNAEDNYYASECQECEDPESCDHVEDEDDDFDDEDDDDQDEDDEEEEEDDEDDQDPHHDDNPGPKQGRRDKKLR